MKQFTLVLLLLSLTLSSIYAQDGANVDLLNVLGDKQLSEMSMQNTSSQLLSNGYYYSIIVLTDIPSSKQAEELKLAGAELLEYISNNAYISQIKKGANLAAFPIKAIYILPIEAKVRANLLNGHHESCIIKNGGLAVMCLPWPGNATDALRNDLLLNGFTFKEHKLENGLEVIVPVDQLLHLAKLPSLYYIDAAPCKPQPEGQAARAQSRLRVANGVNENTSNIGNGVAIAIGDDGAVNHIDVLRRIVDFTNSDEGMHGDMTTGIAIGGGNINPLGMGMAPGADLYLFEIDTYEHILNAPYYYEQNGVVVTSTSYADGSGGQYSYSAQQVDLQLLENPAITHVFSAGNSGLRVSDNPYSGIFNEDGSTYGNITGGRKASKNTITVGNVHPTDQLRITSSRGPSYDSRIKPDICANGQGNMSIAPDNSYQVGGGTSAAAPAVAGVAALMYEAYRDLHNGADPSNALIKGALLNGADDIGRKGPDYDTGWGRLNGSRSLDIIKNHQYFSGVVSHQGFQNFQLNVPAGVGQLKVMLYWMDRPGSLLSTRALVNDLDLTMITPSGQLKRPLVLSTASHLDSLRRLATPGFDRRNNVEQIVVERPATGVFDLSIHGFEIPSGEQEFYVVYTYVMDEIAITFPSGNEAIAPQASEYIHWDAYGEDGTFTISCSYDNGITWEVISDTIAGDMRHYYWNVPNRSSENAWMKIERNGQFDISDASFTIMNRPPFNLDYISETTAAMRWYPVEGAASYEVFKLGEKYLEKIGQTTNNFFNFDTELWEESWYAVQAITEDGKNGPRAIAQKYIHRPCNATMRLDFQFDLYPGEISWYVKPAGEQNIIASGGPYDYLPPNSFLSIERCLPAGCYNLFIVDAYGDGLCCENGEGYYSLYNTNGELIFSKGDFTSQSTIYFCLEEENEDLVYHFSHIEHPSCAGSDDGRIGIWVSGGSGNYQYQWSNGATGPNATGLSEGLHYVTVTDGNLSIQASIVLTAPDPIEIYADIHQPDCGQLNLGSITTQVTGGTAPYQFEWSHGVHVSDATDLMLGTYQLTVTDANGCIKEASFTMEESQELTITGGALHVSCNGSADGAAFVMTQGYDINDLTIQWSTGHHQAQVYNLASGSYTVTVTSADGCQAMTVVNIGEPLPLSLIGTEYPPDCAGEPDGQIELEASGGTGPYTYQWNNGMTGANVQGLYTGYYTVTVTDANSCQLVRPFFISDGLSMDLDLISSNINGSNLGSINLWVNGGVAPYTFQWSNGTSTQHISSLNGGVYSVTVTDANGCTAEGEATIYDDNYCEIVGTNTAYEWIESVALGGSVHPSGNDGGYGNYEAVVFQIQAGVSTDFTLTPQYSFSAPFNEYWKIWIDFNGDMDFDDAGEEVLSHGPIAGSLQGNLVIPANIAEGNYRMRISMKYGSFANACGVFAYGEAEDYSVHILPSVSAMAINSDEIERATVHISEKKKAVDVASATGEMAVWPNPASTHVSVRAPFKDKNGVLELIGAEGKVVKTFKAKMLRSGIYYLHLKGVPAGNYWIRAVEHEDVEPVQLIKTD